MNYLIWLPVVAGAAWAAFAGARRYITYRGARLVQCPESKETVAVQVGAAWAALGGDWRLSDCSRWPERRACGRECLTQIEHSPEDCLVRSIVTKWYEDKNCAVCGKGLDQIDWYDRKPALMNGEGTARPWPDIPAETLPQVLATHRPVCFDCYVAETFRREHADLVVDNPWAK